MPRNSIEVVTVAMRNLQAISNNHSLTVDRKLTLQQYTVHIIILHNKRSMITAEAPPPPLQMLAHPMVASFALSTPYRVATNMMKHISSDYTTYSSIRIHTHDGTKLWQIH